MYVIWIDMGRDDISYVGDNYTLTKELDEARTHKRRLNPALNNDAAELALIARRVFDETGRKAKHIGMMERDGAHLPSSPGPAVFALLPSVYD